MVAGMLDPRSRWDAGLIRRMAADYNASVCHGASLAADRWGSDAILMQQSNKALVIPAKAGIQWTAVTGSRVKPGMTSIGFNLTLY
jgi:hypothetical protein